MLQNTCFGAYIHKTTKEPCAVTILDFIIVTIMTCITLFYAITMIFMIHYIIVNNRNPVPKMPADKDIKFNDITPIYSHSILDLM